MPRKLVIEILGKSDDLERAFGRAGHAADGFGSRLGSLAKMAGLALGAGAVGGLALVLDKSVKAAMAGQASQAALDTALKATHQSIKEMTPALDAAESASRKLGFADDETRTALSRLESATGNTKKAISELGLAEDIARFKHMDLISASQMLAQAMTGSQRAAKQLGIIVSPVTANLDALKASTVDLTTATGKAEEAHAKILDKMATGQAVIDATTAKVHGQAEAMAGTAIGAAAQFQAQLQHVEEELGNKLLPAMTRVLDWVNAHWPQISAVVGTVANAIKWFIENVTIPIYKVLISAGEQLVTSVRAHWAQISAHVESAMRTIRSIIAQVTAEAKRLWEQFGGAITTIAKTYLGAAVGIIRNAFNIISGLFNLVGDLLHGRWGKVWDDIKRIVSNAVQAIWTIIKTFVTVAYTLAIAIGKALIQGVVDGLKGMASAVGGAIHSGVSGAVSFAGSLLHGSGPFQFTNQAIGAPLAQGIIDGFTAGTNALGNIMAAQIKKAVDATKAVIAAAQSDFQTAFQGFQSIADQMFSGIAGASQTKAGKALAALTGKHDAAALTGAITTARTDLGTAQAGGDPAAILAAQQTLDDALYNQHVANLTKLAAAEQIDLTARNQVKQIAFDNALGNLEKHLQKTHASTKTAMDAIQKLLSSYGVSFAQVGADMGDAWVQGLKDAITAAARGSATLARVIGSQANTLGGILGGVPHAATGGYVAQGGLAVIHSGENILAAGQGGGGATINVTVNGWVGNDQQIAARVRQELVLLQRRGGNLGFT